MNSRVHIIDDHQLARDSVQQLLKTMDCQSTTYESAEEFLQRFDPDEPGCIVTDVRLRGMTGVELLQLLKERNVCTPVIVVTGYANTRLAVQALRAGAINLLEKPCDENELWMAVRDGLRIDSQQRGYYLQQKEIRQKFKLLTTDEQRVAKMIVGGMTNKEMAKSLDCSVRTVELRRQNVFKKTGACGVPSLVKLSLLADGWTCGSSDSYSSLN